MVLIFDDVLSSGFFYSSNMFVLVSSFSSPVSFLPLCGACRGGKHLFLLSFSFSFPFLISLFLHPFPFHYLPFHLCLPISILFSLCSSTHFLYSQHDHPHFFLYFFFPYFSIFYSRFFLFLFIPFLLLLFHSYPIEHESSNHKRHLQRQRFIGTSLYLVPFFFPPSSPFFFFSIQGI